MLNLWGNVRVILGLYRGYIGVTLGLYWDSFRVIQRLYRGYGYGPFFGSLL